MNLSEVLAWQEEQEQLEITRFFKGDILKVTIRQRNFNNSSFASCVGVTRGIVTQWINGSKVPTLFNFYKICKVLDIEPSLLLNL
jgi:transcriptional regulator with XRE-family HTH domain